MNKYRTEKDLIGEKELPSDALYGIHTLRAVENFPLSGRRVNSALIHAFGLVKLACAKTNNDLGFLESAKFAAIDQACNEMAVGQLDEHILVDALQGGAGTSTNMNVNEVLANRTLVILGHRPGDYGTIHPIDHINLHQSTNDTYPTALKVALIFKVRELEKELVKLLEEFQKKEKEFADIVKVGRTQMQDAVLTTLGRTMSAYAEAIGRDRWRIFKCEERLRVVNLGGTAIGTGVTAPRQYIFKVTENLKKLTGLGLARAENLVEATQNSDELVEVSGILNACASNFLKIAGDFRLLSSGPNAGIGEIELPARQAGSSLMPGKVNPVIPEAVIQAALSVVSNNSTITQAVGMGSLELNAFMPLIADKLLETVTLLTNGSAIFAEFCVNGIIANKKRCAEHINTSTAVATALVAHLGYEKAQEIAKLADETGKPIKEVAISKKYISLEEFEDLTSPEAVNRLGSKQCSTTVPVVKNVAQASRLRSKCTSINPLEEINNRDGYSTLNKLVPFDFGHPLSIAKRNLPHWQQPGTSYFVTFRLNDSIPKQTIGKIKADRGIWLNQHSKPYSKEDWQEYNRLFSEKIQNLLDAGSGTCLLKDQAISNMVKKAFLHFDKKRYDLGAWVIMPNHTHLIVTPYENNSIQEITHSWKSFTAHEINNSLKKQGEIWQHESFDHIIRNEKQLHAIEKYIIENPIKAKLKKGYQCSTSTM